MQVPRGKIVDGASDLVGCRKMRKGTVVGVPTVGRSGSREGQWLSDKGAGSTFFCTGGLLNVTTARQKNRLKRY